MNKNIVRIHNISDDHLLFMVFNQPSTCTVREHYQTGPVVDLLQSFNVKSTQISSENTNLRCCTCVIVCIINRVNHLIRVH